MTGTVVAAGHPGLARWRWTVTIAFGLGGITISAWGPRLPAIKAGLGIDEILEAIIERIPHPQGNNHSRLRALVFDSTFDTYRGVIIYLRVVDGHPDPDGVAGAPPR